MTIRLYLTEKFPALFKRKKRDTITTKTFSDGRKLIVHGYKNGIIVGRFQIYGAEKHIVDRFENTIKLMLK